MSLPPLSLVPAPLETIQGAAAAQRAGQATAASLLESCLQKIERWEGEVQAWVSVDRPGARRQAEERDAELAAGRDRGPLHGIPLGIKDLIDLAGFPTGAGSALLSQQVVATDAPLVSRLRQAGAVILGKTVTTQFACFDPPPTRNPWNLQRTPGGSSSGSAAAVATGMCLGAIGSQTGGSITRPASFCGVAGCKPTYGTIPVQGVYPVAKSLDHPGPIARCVGDLAILLETLAGSAPLPRQPAAPPRVGRLHGLFDERALPAARDALDRTVRLLAAQGAAVCEATLPASFADLLRSHRTIMLYELYQVHGERFAAHPGDYLPGMTGLIHEAAQVAPAAYAAARAHQSQLGREIVDSFASADVLVCPATIGPAPDPTTTGDPSFNSPWSFTGLPTVSFPIGQSTEGLPLGIQIVARSHDEGGLFRAALWCERIVQESLAG
ncbi:MAG: amidase [Planctomycetales bacterium]